MTSKVTFRRQLWPQPPADARPDWYYINTLGFYKDGKKVWEQDIPERDTFYEQGFFDWLDVPRFYLRDSGSCEVKQDPKFGWYIEFWIAHAEAAKIWEVLFKDNPKYTFAYDANGGGQEFSKKPDPFHCDSHAKIDPGVWCDPKPAPQPDIDTWDDFEQQDCPGCRLTHLMENKTTGEIKCSNCGHVLQKPTTAAPQPTIIDEMKRVRVKVWGYDPLDPKEKIAPDATGDKKERK